MSAGAEENKRRGKYDLKIKKYLQANIIQGRSYICVNNL
jgi:hypothetical protein